MHKRYFPRCQVEGPIDPPVEFCHGFGKGFIPNKCGTCDQLFEGECLRGGEVVGRYLHLDFGPCGIPGPTDPVYFENELFLAKVEIPRKCSKCMHLEVHRIYGFTCHKDRNKWGDNHRGLDWGTWSPDTIYFDLPDPKVTTLKMNQAATSGNLVDFVSEHRRVNPGLSIQEAREDYELIRSKIIGDTQDDSEVTA